MKTIYKYPCPSPGGIVNVNLPPYNIVHVGLDGNNNPCFWAEIDMERKESMVEFFVVGTGWDLSEKDGYWQRHAGTWVEKGFVWHLYGRQKERDYWGINEI